MSKKTDVMQESMMRGGISFEHGFVSFQVADLNDMKLVYAIVALLCFCCAIPFVVSFVCCCEPLSMVPDLQIAKVIPKII